MKTKFGVAIFFLIFSATAICCIPAQAHNLWLNPDNFYPSVGSTVNIGIGWGHKFPANRVDQEIKKDQLEEIRAVDPDGLDVSLEKVSVKLYRLKIEKAGAYVVVARIKPGFFTKTTDGRKWGDKTTVTNSIKCTNFHIRTKTVIVAGGADKNLGHAAGQPLEVIPLADPSNLKNSGTFPVKILFEGKALPKADIKATYAGFVTEDVAPHNPKKNHGHKHHHPVETVTDDQGRAELKLDRAGYWMILLSHKPPYPDLSVCDEYMYNMAFTFQVR
ncbi:DUF4198 domain-containing protein [Desulfonema magnum]|uniref:DUF4198 n=1 Tax=Desulfonema magnum TaxID=45655 RepID=A0A975GT04_9BACT|nr:DUF4198 domain-containing protein [Desulfonema magnum]QTA92579.1 DUF4198 [Desulfonema magnum]